MCLYGDCNGLDSLVMSIFDTLSNDVKPLNIFFTTNNSVIVPRNTPKLNPYVLHPVMCNDATKVFSRDWYSLKDIAMSEQCTHGVVFIQNNSSGSVANYHRLIQFKKHVRAFNIVK